MLKRLASLFAVCLVLAGPVSAGHRENVGLSQLPHVPNNAALTLLPPTIGRVRREGNATSGDGGAADFVLAAGACPLKNGAGDGGSQVGLIGPKGVLGTYVGCAFSDLNTTGSVSVNLWGCIENSNGISGNGTDNTACLTSAFAWSGASGRKIHVPGGETLTNGPGMLRLTAPVPMPAHAFADGDYCMLAGGTFAGMPSGATLPSPGPGSILYFDHAGQGIVYGSGGGGDGGVLANLCMWRNQPTPPIGSDGNGTGASWTPNNNDFDIVDNGDDLRFEHVTLINPTKAIQINAGRFVSYDLRGQWLNTGIDIEYSADVVRLINTHAFPFYSQNTAVLNYMRGNQTLLNTGRADGLRIEEMYAVVGGRCWHVGTTADGKTLDAAVVNTLSCDDFGLGGILTDGNPSVAGGTGPGRIDLHSFGFGGSVGSFTPGPAIDSENGFKINAYGFSSGNDYGSTVVLKNGSAASIYGNPVIQTPNRSNAANTPVFSVDATSYLSVFGAPQPLGTIPSNFSLWSTTGNITQNSADPRTNWYPGSGLNCSGPASLITVPANGSVPLPTPSGGGVLLTDQTNGQAALWTLGGSVISQPLTGAIANNASTSGFLTGTPTGPSQIGLVYNSGTGLNTVYSSYSSARNVSVCNIIGRQGN